MEPENLTIHILREIRDEVRGTNARLDSTNERLDKTNERLESLREEMLSRFEVVETTLRDLAEQLVVLGRGVKVALEHRRGVDRRVDDLETRVAKLEERDQAR